MKELLKAILERASDPETIHDMAEGLSPAPSINPKATSDQLKKAEDQLGFKLPELLRFMYLEIGNGGYGPGYGLYDLDELVAEYQGLVKDTPLNWNKELLPICTWGCTYYSCVDLKDEEHGVFFCDVETHHILDDDNKVSFALYDKDGNLLSTENPFQQHTPSGPHSDVELMYVSQRETFAEFMADWSDGIDLWSEMVEDDDDYDDEDEEFEEEEDEREHDDRRN